MPRDLEKEVLFTPALDASKSGYYLGDRRTVEMILRLAISDIMERMLTAKTDDAKKDILNSVMTKYAKIFLGKVSEYQPLRRWNEPGGIDGFVAKWTGSAETDPMERVKHGVLKLYGEVLDLNTYASTPGILKEQWEWQLDAIFNRYAGIFIGMSPAQQEALTLSSTPEKNNVSNEE